MKKMTFFAFAAMLLSAVVLIGCKNEKEPEKVKGVTTDIAVSLPGQVGSGALHMPSVTVQRNGQTDFGSNGMVSMTLVPFGPSAAITTASTRLGDNIVLGEIGTSYSYTNSPNGRSKVYTGKTVPMGTSAFLFYGVSGRAGTDFEVGKLTASLAGQPSAFTFTLAPIYTTDITTNASYTNLIKYLNAVANASDGTKAWKEYTAADNEGLYELFVSFSKAHVLNSFGIQFMMTDLYKSLVDNTTAIATAIKDSIALAAYASVDGTTHEVTLASGLQNFPASINLPEGSFAVAYSTSAKKFDGNGAHAYGSLDPSQVDFYVYPAQLWYRANTLIKTSTSSKLDLYTNSALSWKSILGQYEKDNGSVNATTRSVALKDTIQYAVARMDVYVKFKEGTNLEDNDPVAAQNKISNPTDGYPLTAVLVGGQKNVGFDFTQATYAGSATDVYTIYDKEITASTAYGTTDYVFQNSSLVLETPANTNEFIALEFTNTSTKDFYGVGNDVIPVGAKFYLVGQLTASAATETANHVFLQDYTTIVKVAIKDLKSAYSTIPNLKAPELEIGLSVDLEWRDGHTYELEL